jgi:two-component system, NtrC family, response regulator HydG
VKRILLVEDEKDVRLVLEHVLVTAGYAVDSVATAQSARAWLGMRRYDLVVADGRLGDGTGLEIADLALNGGMKTLIVTGNAISFAPGELERYPYLLKPVRAHELERAVTRLMAAPLA